VRIWLIIRIFGLTVFRRNFVGDRSRRTVPAANAAEMTGGCAEPWSFVAGMSAEFGSHTPRRIGNPFDVSIKPSEMIGSSCWPPRETAADGGDY